MQISSHEIKRIKKYKCIKGLSVYLFDVTVVIDADDKDKFKIKDFINLIKKNVCN